MIRLINDNISKIDISRLTEWLQTVPRLTMGDKTIEFEAAFSEWLGMDYTVYVNSGSSANLLMVYVMKYVYGVKKIAVPALSWATDLAPLLQLGIEPVLIDCNMENLGLDLDDLEDVLKNDPDIGAVISVSVLGLVPDMVRLVKICKDYEVELLEDNCESMGSKTGIVNLGTYGLMSTHSLYFGHHISTIEGGLISTNDRALYNLLKMFRSHGWSRNVDDDLKHSMEKLWDIDDFESWYTFYVPGFNLRSTDLQAFIGLGQMAKLNGIARKRFDNFLVYIDLLKDSGIWIPEFRWFDFISNLGFPIISEERQFIVKRLQDNGIEVRPIISGSMGNQPMYKKEYGYKLLMNADKIDKYGFYVPNHPELTVTDIKKVCRLILNRGGY